MKIMITGGAGFIGSAACRYFVQKNYDIYNIDKLSYAANLASLSSIAKRDNYHFFAQDIGDSEAISAILNKYQIEAIINFAAESHVDRSLASPRPFLDNNVIASFNLLETARQYWENLPASRKERFRFFHISTDEVFGDLPFDKGIFRETSPYKPSSPYAASKAAMDHFVKAWHHSFGFPILLSNCSNNYGPRQFPEKLIPLMIITALKEKNLPIYGDGSNIRDWLYVKDHIRAIEMILLKGQIGQSYNIGARNEKSNLELIQLLCSLLDKYRPRPNNASYHDLISFVSDRPGHDKRYAIDPSKIENELGWRAKESFETGLDKTIRWYLANEKWWQIITQKRLRQKC